ncbi:MAG: M13 family metallopeptidase [Atopobiaceae bacterium]|nr:M13 family metallopeptidase [Atopobiaceae bacterium]
MTNGEEQNTADSIAGDTAGDTAGYAADSVAVDTADSAAGSIAGNTVGIDTHAATAEGSQNVQTTTQDSTPSKWRLGCITMLIYGAALIVFSVLDYGCNMIAARFSNQPNLLPERIKVARIMTYDTGSASPSRYEELSLELEGEPWKDWFVYGVEQEAEQRPRLEDDFYTAINGEWIAERAESGFDMYSPVYERFEQIAFDMAEFLESDKAGSEATQQDVDNLRTMYTLCRDWDNRNVDGYKPLLPIIERIGAIDTMDEMSEFLCSDDYRLSKAWKLDDYGDELEGHALFGFDAYKDTDENSDGEQTASGYSLDIVPANYQLAPLVNRKKAAEGEELVALEEAAIDAELAYWQLRRLGYDKREIMHTLSQAATLDYELKYAANYAGDSDTDETADGRESIPTYRFPWDKILSSYGFETADSVNCSATYWLKKLDSVYIDDNLELFKSHMLVSLLIDSAEYLDEEAYYDASSVTGSMFLPPQTQETIAAWPDTSDFEHSEETLDRYDRIYTAYDIERLMPVSYAKVYIDNFYDETRSTQIREMTEQIIAAYEEMLQEQEWLPQETRQAAINKLQGIRMEIGHPDEWPDTSQIQLVSHEDGGTLFSNMRLLAAWELEQEHKILEGEIDVLDWTTCLEPNAFYYLYENAIYIGVGYLGGPYWSDDASYEEVLGSVGTTIGHELSHAFDSTGAYFDEHGEYDCWWSSQDSEKFDERVQRVQASLEQIDPLGLGAYDGELTCDELISDLAGMKVALRVAQTVPDFDYDSFFRAYTRSWTSVTSFKKAYEDFYEDEHPFDNTRVNMVLRECDEFIDTYNISENDAMWLEPSERISVW